MTKLEENKKIEEILKGYGIVTRLREEKGQKKLSKYDSLDPAKIKILIIGQGTSGNEKVYARQPVIIRPSLNPCHNGMLTVQGFQKLTVDEYLKKMTKDLTDWEIIGIQNLSEVLPEELMYLYEEARHRVYQEKETDNYQTCLDILSVLYGLLNGDEMLINPNIERVLENIKVLRVIDEQGNVSYEEVIGTVQQTIRNITKKYQKEGKACCIDEVHSLNDLLTIEEKKLYEYAWLNANIPFQYPLKGNRHLKTCLNVIDIALKRLRENGVSSSKNMPNWLRIKRVVRPRD